MFLISRLHFFVVFEFLLQNKCGLFIIIILLIEEKNSNRCVANIFFLVEYLLPLLPNRLSINSSIWSNTLDHIQHTGVTLWSSTIMPRMQQTTVHRPTSATHVKKRKNTWVPVTLLLVYYSSFLFLSIFNKYWLLQTRNTPQELQTKHRTVGWDFSLLPRCSTNTG